MQSMNVGPIILVLDRGLAEEAKKLSGRTVATALPNRPLFPANFIPERLVQLHRPHRRHCRGGGGGSPRKATCTDARTGSLPDATVRFRRPATGQRREAVGDALDQRSAILELLDHSDRALALREIRSFLGCKTGETEIEGKPRCALGQRTGQLNRMRPGCTVETVMGTNTGQL